MNRNEKDIFISYTPHTHTSILIAVTFNLYFITPKFIVKLLSILCSAHLSSRDRKTIDLTATFSRSQLMLKILQYDMMRKLDRASKSHLTTSLTLLIQSLGRAP